MQTHDDRDHEPGLDEQQILRKQMFMRELRRRAAGMLIDGSNEITAGNADENWLAIWSDEQQQVTVGQLPDDPQGILRISIGGGDHLPVNANYCVFRGDRIEAIKLLERALQALRYKPPAMQSVHPDPNNSRQEPSQ